MGFLFACLNSRVMKNATIHNVVKKNKRASAALGFLFSGYMKHVGIGCAFLSQCPLFSEKTSKKGKEKKENRIQGPLPTTLK